MKIWIGESKELIKDCIDHLIKNYGASDHYNIKSKIYNPTYLEQVNYLYLLNNNTIGSGRDRDKFEAIKAKELHLHDLLYSSKLISMSVENTKIWIGGDVEKSKKVQEILFKLGCKLNGRTQVSEINYKYLRVDSDKTIYFSTSCEKDFFLELDEIEISYEDLLKILQMGSLGRTIPPTLEDSQKLMCRCGTGMERDISVDKIPKEESFIIPQHLLKTKPVSTQQIPSWGGKLYVIPPKGKMRPRIKAKRAWEIL